MLTFPSLDEGSKFWKIWSGWVILFIFLVFFASYLILFPFYVYVNKVSRTRDQKNFLFPTVNHFFKMIQVVYTFFAFSLLIFIIGFSLGSRMGYFSKFPLSFMSFALCIWLLILVMILVFYILTILLAIEKFTLYFFPATERFVILAQKYQIKYIWCLYLATFIFQFIMIVNSLRWGMHALDAVKIEMVTYVCLNIILILASLLYLPILINVRKFSHLPSIQQNNPQKYIFWQTFNVLIFKLTFFASVAYSLIFLTPYEQMVILLLLGDIFIIPLVIQVSYICCNKKSMDTLFKSFSWIKFINILFNIKEKTPIAPQTVPRVLF